MLIAEPTWTRSRTDITGRIKPSSPHGQDILWETYEIALSILVTIFVLTLAVRSVLKKVVFNTEGIRRHA